MKIKILIPVYNDWQSVVKLLENINSEVRRDSRERSVSNHPYVFSCEGAQHHIGASRG